MLDIIDSKLYRPKHQIKNHHLRTYVLSIFRKKGFGCIKPSKILDKPDAIAHLPNEVQNKERRPVIT